MFLFVVCVGDLRVYDNGVGVWVGNVLVILYFGNLFIFWIYIRIRTLSYVLSHKKLIIS